MYWGWLISVAALLPNLLALFYPPRDAPVAEVARSTMTTIMVIVERVGQAASFIIPFLYRVRPEWTGFWPGVGIMVVALAFYYAGWARYMLRGRTYDLLFRPMLGIPQPMAVSPIVYFFGGALMLGSVPLAIGASALTVGHLYVSAHEYRRWQGSE